MTTPDLIEAVWQAFFKTPGEGVITDEMRCEAAIRAVLLAQYRKSPEYAKAWAREWQIPLTDGGEK